ncbi:MAG: PSD1 and planctomycete cytochrome C domain-containing protein [Acidobacteriota bacterium]
MKKLLWILPGLCLWADDTALLSVLRQHCAGCHSGPSPQAGLSVENIEALRKGGKRGPALLPGHASQSSLVDYLKGLKTPRMPLGAPALDPALIATVEKSIDAMPPTTTLTASPSLFRPPLPSKDGPQSIDAFLRQKLDLRGWKPAPEASRRTLIRRLYFDLLGVPPPPGEVRAFLANPAPDAYPQLIDKLLADKRYGERWGRHWLDLVRYAESDGFAIDSERPTAWRYRDYVIRAFNDDKPYDQFILEQLAGDEYRGPKPAPLSERLVALGFLRLAPWEADANSKKLLRQDFLNDITATVGSAFLGLTTGCAQCHDHKYDPIPQKDYYRLQAFFAATATADLPAPFDPVENPAAMKRRQRAHEDAAEAAQQELDQQRDLLKKRYLSLFQVNENDDGLKRFLNRLNIKNLFFLEQDLPLVKEPGWKEPIHAYFDTRDRMQREQELARRYQALAYSVRDIAPPAAPDIPDTFVLTGGDLDARGEKVEPAFLSCVTGRTAPAAIPFAGGSTGRRVALAEWIASKDNPFTARVIVNRVWQHHFGEGLVRTPSDFGKNGEPATHPELLDWLAVQFVDNKWSIKALHKLILLSAAYRQSSVHPEQSLYAAADPTNKLLWRMNWRRLDAEVIRDSVLSLSGRLNPEMFGPPVLFPVPDDVAQGFEFFKWFPSPEPQQLRRSIYLMQRRSVLHPLSETFDAPNLSTSCSRRQTTIVAPQALTLLHGELTRTESKHFAARLARAADPLAEAFWLTLARDPSPAERQSAANLTASGPDGLASLAAVLFNLNEFLFVE